jgi:hypothetical protein
MPLSRRELNRALLARQLLLQREKLPVLDAVERLVALQAQLARPPFIALWTRLAAFRREQLAELLKKRKLVRATALRGTIHLMSARDFIATRGVIQESLSSGMKAILRERAQSLDIDELARHGREFFAKTPATFDELRPFLLKKDPKGDERAMAYAVRLHLPLVQVPTDDAWSFPAAAYFTLADVWLGKQISTSAMSPHALVRRYLSAFGPASVSDAQTWTALQSLRDVFEELRPTLTTFRDDRKRELFDLPDAPRPNADTPAPVRFVGDFDNTLLAHADRTRIIADEHRAHVITKNLQVRPTFLVDGFVAGTWKVERKKKLATLVLSPFGKLTKQTRASLEAEGDTLLTFLEADAPAREIRTDQAIA